MAALAWLGLMTPLLSAAAWSWEWQPAAANHTAAHRHGIIHLSVFICNLLEVSEMRALPRQAASTLMEPAASDLKGSKSRTSTGACHGKIHANPGPIPSLRSAGIRIYLQGEWG